LIDVYFFVFCCDHIFCFHIFCHLFFSFSLAVLGSVLTGSSTTKIISENGLKEALKLEPNSVFDFVTKSTVRFTQCGIGFFSEQLWGKELGGLFGWHGFGGEMRKERCEKM
jgi:hypothetical protein